MSLPRLDGRGRLVPAQLTGIVYQVHHGIQLAKETPQYNRGWQSAEWAKCSIRLVRAGYIPNGIYFLYTEEGRVHQLRFVDGKWHYLAVSARSGGQSPLPSSC
jgi:hypothetical protein